RPPGRAHQPARAVPTAGAARRGGSVGIDRHDVDAAVRRTVPSPAHDARTASVHGPGVDRLVAVELEAELRVELERAARVLRVDAERGLLVAAVAELS